MAKKEFTFKPEYEKASKISLYNKTLQRRLPLTKDQVLRMAKRGTLTQSQVQALFKSTPKVTDKPV